MNNKNSKQNDTMKISEPVNPPNINNKRKSDSPPKPKISKRPHKNPKNSKMDIENRLPFNHTISSNISKIKNKNPISKNINNMNEEYQNNSNDYNSAYETKINKYIYPLYKPTQVNYNTIIFNDNNNNNNNNIRI